MKKESGSGLVELSKQLLMPLALLGSLVAFDDLCLIIIDFLPTWCAFKTLLLLK